MTILEEVKEEIKSRASNPLIGSFLIAFLIFNWYTPLTLLFYKQSELSLDGNFKSYKDVIYSQIDILRNLIYPLLVAILYVLAMPFIRGKIEEYQEGVAVTFKNNITKHKRRLLNIAEENEKLVSKNEELKGAFESAKELAQKQAIELQVRNSRVKQLEEEIASIVGINTEILGNWQVKFLDGRTSDKIWSFEKARILERDGNIDREKYQIIDSVGAHNQVIFTLQSSDANIVPLVITKRPDLQNPFQGVLNRDTGIVLSKHH